MFQSVCFEDKRQWENAANEDLPKDQMSLKFTLTVFQKYYKLN